MGLLSRLEVDLGAVLLRLEAGIHLLRTVHDADGEAMRLLLLPPLHLEIAALLLQRDHALVATLQVGDDLDRAVTTGLGTTERNDVALGLLAMVLPYPLLTDALWIGLSHRERYGRETLHLTALVHEQADEDALSGHVADARDTRLAGWVQHLDRLLLQAEILL